MRASSLALKPPWIAGVLLALWCLVIMVVAARVNLLGRFDDGIEYTTVTYLLHGQLPFTDFYEPYGVGLGIPGALPHLVGLDSVFALRLTYALFPPLVTLLVTPLVWRRCGALLGGLAGLISITSQTPRYSMGFAALFGFLLLVDGAIARSSCRTLRAAAEEHPRRLLVASAICSLAGWARVEYAVFAVIWAIVLVLALPRSRPRWVLSGATLLLAAAPTIVVAVTGGLRRLWWFVSYTLSPSQSGFHAQRGQPIEWHQLSDWLTEIVHLRLGESTPAAIVGSYGVALVVVTAGVLVLLVPEWRRRLLSRDPSYVTAFMIVICAVVLYGQAARFSTTYGAIGNPVFWVTGAMLLGKRPPWPLMAAIIVLAYPLLQGVSPGRVHGHWSSRPSVANRVPVPGFNRIPIAQDGGPASMAALIYQWHELGLQGRATLAVELRNDVAWGNEAIVGYLLDAPAAAWPLAYDPGLVNTDRVERETVAELCRDRAPIVQGDGDYPYPPGKPVYIGSRLLDEFLAVNYEIAAVAGFYRILLPSGPRCQRVERLSDLQLRALQERWLQRGEEAPAGAIAIALLERQRTRGQPANISDAAVAALGGYQLSAKQLRSGPLAAALVSLGSPRSNVVGFAPAAAYPWPTDVERLAAQTAWVAHRSPTEAATPQAAAATYALALRHANWPRAIANLSAIEPPSAALFARLGPLGAAGTSEFDRWRRGYFLQSGQADEAIAAGVALVLDYIRRRDPVHAGAAELELATYPGVSVACAAALRRHAGHRPGVRVAAPPSGPPCPAPRLAAVLGQPAR